MAQNAWNQARMCLLGVSSKNGHPHPNWPPKFENFALRKPFFAQNTHKSCSKKVRIWSQILHWKYSLMALSAHAHLKWPKWSKKRPNWQKFRFCTKPWTDNLIIDLYSRWFGYLTTAGRASTEAFTESYTSVRKNIISWHKFLYVALGGPWTLSTLVNRLRRRWLVGNDLFYLKF